MILYVRKPKYKGLVFKVKTYGGLDSWDTRWLSGGGSIPLKTVKIEKEKKMKGKEVIPTSLRRDINKYGNSYLTEVTNEGILSPLLDKRIYVVAKRKAVEVYLSSTYEYLGNAYFRGNYFVFSPYLQKSLSDLSQLERWELDDSLCRYFRRMVDRFIFRG